MTKLDYELIEPVDGFEEGDVLVVTAQYGDWHPYDVKLEPRANSESGAVELTWDRLREVGVAPEEPTQVASTR